MMVTVLKPEVSGNPGPKGEGGAGDGSFFSLDTLFLLVISLVTVLVVNRVPALKMVIKPKA